MLGLAGGLAALFLLAFVVLGMRFVVESRIASMVAGALMIGSAYVLLRAARSDFSAMFAFALSLVGQALLGYGMVQLFDRDSNQPGPWAAMAVVEAILAVVMSNFIHRFAAAYLAGLMLATALSVAGAGALAIGVLAAFAAAAWLFSQQPAARQDVILPVGYGAALCLIHAESSMAWEQWMLIGSDRVKNLPAWSGEALALAVFLVVIAMLLRQAGWRANDRRFLIAIVSAAMVGAASLKVPGIASGLMLVLLGFAGGRSVLMGLGIMALLFYISSYYYRLDVTLLYKSGVLAATGLVLLAARWLMLRVVLPAEGRDA